jgi:hypothetical protein
LLQLIAKYRLNLQSICNRSWAIFSQPMISSNLFLSNYIISSIALKLKDVASGICTLRNVVRIEHAPENLVSLDGFKQGLEISFSESFIAFSLNELKEHRSEHCLRKNL